ncbi:Alpha/Beta hydrolase protein, partial [Chytriomyces sp. MP71]
ERVILYIHGGAYCLLSRKTHRGITWKLAKYAACRVLSIDYRLAPEHTFPLPLQDAISAYSFLVNPPAGQVRYEPGNVIFMGDSAGGGLALATILWLREHGPKYGLEMPGGAGLLSPWLDLSHSMPSFRTNAAFDFLPEKVQDKMLNEERNHYYVKNNSFLQHPLVSPFFSSPDAPLPPLLIQIGECERLRDENLAFALARHASVRLELYEAMVHVFHFFSPVYPFAEVALERLGRFA